MKSQLLRGRLGSYPGQPAPGARVHATNTARHPCDKGRPGSGIQGSFSVPPYVGYTVLTGRPLLESHPSRGFPEWLLGPPTQAPAHPSTSGPLGLCLPPSSPRAPSAQLRPPMGPKRPYTQRVPSQAQPQLLSSVPGDSVGAQADEMGDAPWGGASGWSSLSLHPAPPHLCPTGCPNDTQSALGTQGSFPRTHGPSVPAKSLPPRDGQPLQLLGLSLPSY